MSKKNNIVLIVSIVIAVIAVIVCVWYVDNTKIVESYMDVALKIKEKKTQNNLNESGPYAYVVEEKDNKIICTVYGTQDYTRLLQVLELENGKVVKSSHEMYFPNKLSAKLYDIEQQKAHDAEAELRRSQIGTGDRSEKIRTYNFPQGRVTDHRIKLTLHRLDAILNGDLDEIINSLITADQAAKLSNLQEQA